MSLSIFLAIMVFAPNHYYYMVGSGLAGFFSSGLGAYTLPMELVSADKRFIVGTLITAGWATGAGWYLLSSFVKFPISFIFFLNDDPIVAIHTATNGTTVCVLHSVIHTF